jgi:hypothetical protein
MKTITLILFKWFFYKVLVGHYISIETPKQGRLSKRRLKEIYKKIQEEQKILQTKSELSQYKSHGNRLMVFCGVISLAAYRGLRNEGLSHQYATQLVADVIWKVYILGAKTLWLATSIIAREPQKRLNYALRILCKYPFNTDPKGYQFKLQIMPDHLSMDFTQCVVHQFMKFFGNDEEMDFFRNSWCLYDFALPAYLIGGGGYYEREHTLSHGDNICDMKWYAKSTKSENINLTSGSS